MPLRENILNAQRASNLIQILRSNRAICANLIVSIEYRQLIGEINRAYYINPTNLLEDDDKNYELRVIMGNEAYPFKVKEVDCRIVHLNEKSVMRFFNSDKTSLNVLLGYLKNKGLI